MALGVYIVIHGIHRSVAFMNSAVLRTASVHALHDFGFAKFLRWHGAMFTMNSILAVGVAPCQGRKARERALNAVKRKIYNSIPSKM